ncbi:lantibiotic dehydratase C-terminal domain-containing protein [Sphaerisporangium perillae]|uniref:lantibiotic dehydratase C-terminal domain-containing protein n=1 Tax=Sphaerisporangium perillae TaxID=2935860 RepID=UPI0020100244|nr:lantibiotic dehydratase C-terminal domain-containing protein [Sphaerisporangium perillae]
MTGTRTGARTGADQGAAGRWVSAHLFHFGDLDALVTGVVEPVVRELAADGTARGHFFLRYWEGGQHVRLRVEVPDPSRAAHARDLVRERAAAHFAARPSPPVDLEAYRAFAATVARGERRERYDERLHRTDSVEFIAYRPEHAAYGGAACVSAAERHFTVSSALALDVLRAGAGMERRAAIGLAALTIALAACEPDLPAATRRFAAAAREAGRRPEIPGGEDDWLRRRDALLAQTRGLWDLPESGGGLLGAWASSVRGLRDDLAALHAAGRCAPSDSGSPHAFLAMAVPPERRTVPLVLLRCAHLFHNRLGLRAGTEHHVSFLLARALADLAGRIDSRR